MPKQKPSRQHDELPKPKSARAAAEKYVNRPQKVVGWEITFTKDVEAAAFLAGAAWARRNGARK